MRRERSLNPSFRHLIAERSRPHWARTRTARNVLAAALLLVAIALFLRGDPTSDAANVVAARHDLAPGRILSADDVRVVEVPAGTVPEGAITDTADVVGHTLAGPRRGGEVFTDLAVLNPRLTAAAAGIPDARVVPIRLADPRVADLLREGDRVDVLTADDDTQATLAADAAVILVSASDSERDRTDRVVLLALPSADAKIVAGASLTNALAVVLR